MKKFRTTLLSLMVLMSSTLFAQKDIHFNLSKGKIFRLQENISQKAKQKINGMDQQSNMELSSITAFEVVSKTPKETKLGITIEKMTLSLQVGPNTMDFNSDNPIREGNLIDEIYSGFINNQFYAILKPTGQVDHIEGFDELFDQIFENLTIPAGISKDQIKDQVKQNLSSETFKTNIETLTYIFPDHPVKVGDKWTNEQEGKSNFSVLMKNQWEVKSLSQENVLLHGNTTISTRKDEKANFSGLPGQVILTGNVITNYNMDPKTGWVKNGEKEMTMQGTISLDKNPQLPDGMEIPVEIEVISKIKAI